MKTVLYWSQYNYLYCSEKYGHLLYNAETNNFAKLSEEFFCLFKKIESGECLIEDVINQATISSLIKQKILVSDKNAYLYKRRMKYYFQAFDTSNLGLAVAPTTACNFICPYCYEGEMKEKVQMSEQTEQNLLSFIGEHKRTNVLNLTWYGGEPLMGFSSIQRILHGIKQIKHLKLGLHNMPTNGYLLNEEVCRFFSENPMNSIQVTLDGAKEYHNKMRMLPGNKPTFDTIIGNIDTFIKFTSLGYCDFYQKINVTPGQKNSYDFTLIKEEKLLQEVEVLAQKPTIVNKNDRYIVKIQNTSLSDAGNAVNVLRRVPFVIVDNITKQISIAGRGATLIMIDGRKIIGTQELETLNSQNIKDVEVIENPSAKYEAEGHAVINIITFRNENRGLNIDIDASYQRARHNSGKTETAVTYVLPKMLFFMQYGYTATNNEGFNSEVRNLSKENTVFSLKSEDKSNLFKNRIHDYSFGINYTPAKNHFIGLKYNGFAGTVAGVTLKDTEYSKNETSYPLEILNHKKDDTPNRGNINVNYAYGKNGYEFSFLSDYTYSNTKSTSLIKEYDIAQSYDRVMNNNWQAKYNVFSAQFDMKVPVTFVDGGNIEFGLKYSIVKSNNESKFYKNNHGQPEIVPEFTSDILFSEKILGTYFMFSGKSNNGFRYSAGIRHEYLQNNNEERGKNVLQKPEIENDFFPSATFAYSVSKDLNFRTSYSRRIVRPSYSTLNNSVWYINSFSSRQGNPQLKSSIYNTISLSAQWKKIIFSTTASYIQNPIDLLYVNDSVLIEKHIVKSLNTESRWSYSFICRHPIRVNFGIPARFSHLPTWSVLFGKTGRNIQTKLPDFISNFPMSLISRKQPLPILISFSISPITVSKNLSINIRSTSLLGKNCSKKN